MASAETKKLLEFDEARLIVEKAVKERRGDLKTETAPLHQAFGRVLAQDVVADRNYPALARSLRDGFAVKRADLPGTLRLTGEVRAGDLAHATFKNGEAIEIMTGAPVPPDADAIVMVEHVKRLQDGAETRIKIEKAPDEQQWINAPGTEAVAGQALVIKGTRLDAGHLAVLAMVGCVDVPVYAKPTVAILSTGDELVNPDQKPEAHQIRNTNSLMLAAAVESSGGAATILPVVIDEKAELKARLQEGLKSDMLLVSGGVSAGKYDLVKPMLRELGVEFLFERVRIQPGQPTAFGLVGTKPVFGLPGNPGSSLVTFELFAKPALLAMAGEEHIILPLLKARFKAPFRHRLGLTRFLPARLDDDGMHLEHIKWQGSSDLPAIARANIFLVADHDRETWEVGDEIRTMRKP